MRFGSTAILVICQLGITGVLASAGAQAQTLTGVATIALKSGESTEVGSVYYVSNCRSLLKSTPEAEVIEGPQGVTATIKEAMVIPRVQNCANRVAGGTLVVSAKDIEDASYTRLTIRITYNTRDGERKFSHVFYLSLFP
jgi:hypothetical protein